MATFDANTTRRITELAGKGNINLDELLKIINPSLPPDRKVVIQPTTSIGVYKTFLDSDMVKGKVELVTTGMWSNDSGSLTTFFTSSAQTTSTNGKYFWEVYNTNSSDTQEVQFSIAYGHANGSGSVSLATNSLSTLATRATYSQYKSILLNPNDSYFSFENSDRTLVDSKSIYVINVSRERFREKIDPGNWEIALSGSNGTFTFIDDSGKKFSDTAGYAGRVFKVVSGSLNIGTQNQSTIVNSTAPNGLGYGLFYPDRGIIVLNPAAMGSLLGNVTFSTGSGHSETGNVSGSLSTQVEAYNQARLFSSIKLGSKFVARRTEQISTEHFFVRATNREFNYTNNPTAVNSNGTLVYDDFITNPTTYITTIGLYNDSNELIAVAKTSQPIPKSPDKEVLIRVKLSF